MNYRELAFMRFDSECWECDSDCHADLNVTKTDTFEGWDAWKKYNQDGYDTAVTFIVKDKKIVIFLFSYCFFILFYLFGFQI